MMDKQRNNKKQRLLYSNKRAGTKNHYQLAVIESDDSIKKSINKDEGKSGNKDVNFEFNLSYRSK